MWSIGALVVSVRRRAALQCAASICFSAPFHDSSIRLVDTQHQHRAAVPVSISPAPWPIHLTRVDHPGGCCSGPPHFWALAIAIHDDYAAANVPMLPVVKGDAAAARFS
jgi:hypothetical protein